jgi:hypothetical protein
MGSLRIGQLVSVAVILSIASAAPAQTTVRTSSSEGRGHREILDVLFLAAAMGVVAGHAGGDCRGTSFDVGPVFGTTALAAVLSIGGSPNAYERRHPEIEEVPAATTLGDLKATENWRTRVEIIEQNGELSTGELIDITDDAVVLQTEQGRRTVSQTSILDINRVERDRIWDTPLFGAGIGAAWGLLWSHACGDYADAVVTELPRGRMMITGGVVVGLAAFVVDILHQKRTALFRGERRANTSRVHVSPVMWPNGVGVSVSWRSGDFARRRPG